MQSPWREEPQPIYMRLLIPVSSVCPPFRLSLFFLKWRTLIYCFTANNGGYLIDCHVADPLVDTVKPWATSSFEAERLWRLSEKLVGQEFPY